MAVTEKTHILSENDLINLIKKSFLEGALSHSKWVGQPDTCWSNVHEDMGECSECLIKELNEE